MSASSRTIEHVGEWAVEIEADSVGEVFSSLAATVATAAGPPSQEWSDWEAISLRARDPESLLIAFANELISLGEVHETAFSELSDLDVRLDDECSLSCRMRGRRVHSWLSPLKAATYHGARLRGEDDSWEASILFDV